VSRAPIAESVSRRLHDLLADPDIRRWHKDHRSGSTADLQLAQLELFCRRTGVDVHQLVELGREQITLKSRRFQDAVSDWVDSMRKAGRPDSYIALNFAAVRSWLKYNEAAPQWKPALVVRTGTTIDDEQVPTASDWRRVLALSDARGRAAILFLLSTGARIGVLANRYSTNGLRYSDLPDFDVDAAKFTQVPFLVKIPPELSKTKRRYASFGTHEAAEAVEAYTAERLGRGERIMPSSPVITVDRRAGFDRRRKSSDGSVFLTEEGLSTVLKKTLTLAIPKNTPRPYVTRAWASTQLLLGESKGLITRDFRESLLGHSLGVAGRYNLDKRWRADLVEEMRDAYRRCEPLLSTLPEAREGVDAAAMSRMLLLGFGYTEEELASTDLSNLSAVQDLVAKKMGARAETQSRQKVVSSGELARYLDEGWTVVVALNPKQVVLNPPNPFKMPSIGQPQPTGAPPGQSFAQ
jgi:integrase